MVKRILAVVTIVIAFVSIGMAQVVAEKVDTAVISKIKNEGLNNSQVMDILSYLTDVYGPRLNASPEYKEGAEWVAKKLASWGLQNIHFEKCAPVSKGWTLKRFALNAIDPQPFPIIGYPKAWSPGVKGTVTGEAILFDAKTEAELESFKGKLKGKFVLVSDEREVPAHFEADGKRLTDSELLRLANAAPQSGGGRRFRGMPDFSRMSPASRDSAVRVMVREFMPDADSARIARFLSQARGGGGQNITPQKLEMCLKEGALVVFDIGRGDGGNLIVQSATVPQTGGAAPGQRVSPYDAKAPQIIPQVTLAAEHYNRLVRMIKKDQKVKMEMVLDVAMTPADSSFNVIAEIPGTDLKDEVVLIGGHFDTWHGGTGATDDCSGVAACMEAARIIKTLSLQPRRTIRLGFWAAEEQGLIGSSEYVKQHYAEREGAAGASPMGGGTGELKKKPEFDKLSVYFNHDNGTGKIRGVYLQGNETARTIFRTWLEPFASMGASTISIQNTGGTDHQSFDGVGLPGFQFIQDPIEYDARTHHYTMDVYERLQADDMKQAATIMAAFAYNAAMRDALFPRKPAEAPRPRTPGSN
ncbi:M20/M25/M40 family metallo-hydrolase [bacterium]|nr:MAG: M20/M25/M40 family metallo-hydrolase [bacterium]